MPYLRPQHQPNAMAALLHVPNGVLAENPDCRAVLAQAVGEAVAVAQAQGIQLLDNDPDYKVYTGGISAGTGGTIQAHAVGHTAGSFYVYQQVYDADGMPIEGQVVDRNGDGQISEDDQYFYKNPVAPVTMGLASRLEYKNWDFGFSLRASIGNYVYNNNEQGMANVNPTEVWKSSLLYMNNYTYEAIARNWQTYQITSQLSDFYVHNASFLKCDNITLGYSFKTYDDYLNGRVYLTASNVFTITKYDGLDPEVANGFDSNMYPRPMTFILGVNLNF